MACAVHVKLRQFPEFLHSRICDPTVVSIRGDSSCVDSIMQNRSRMLKTGPRLRSCWALKPLIPLSPEVHII